MTSDPHLPDLRAQLKTAEEQLYRLAVQREWLTGHLAEIDGAIGPPMTPNESRN
jgi:hypothetical protein